MTFLTPAVWIRLLITQVICRMALQEILVNAVGSEIVRNKSNNKVLRCSNYSVTLHFKLKWIYFMFCVCCSIYQLYGLKILHSTWLVHFCSFVCHTLELDDSKTWVKEGSHVGNKRIKQFLFSHSLG